MRLIAVLTATLLAAPLAAQTPAAIAADPARVAAAERLVASVFPKGTMATMMGGMSGLTDQMMRSMFGASFDSERKRDPYFDTRIKRLTDVMFTELGALMGEMEPQYVAAIAASLARSMNLDDLNKTAAFFATPAGQSYARQSLMMMQDPQVQQSMGALVPRVTAAMPAIMAKAQAATADLPPPPPPAKPAPQ